jgi:hypothetical protein
MLKNPNEKNNLRFKIELGNLKKEYKDNYYLATKERSVENSVVECLFLYERSKAKYITIIKNVLGNEIKEDINLSYFENWKIKNK